MSNKITRRGIVKGGLIAGALVPAFGWIGHAAATAGAKMPPLDPKEPSAVTLGFVDDGAQVDKAANPRYAAGQTCATCEQFLGKSAESRAGCVLFPGRSVPAAGWCKVWRQTTKA